jgi:hypothetical protein
MGAMQKPEKAQPQLTFLESFSRDVHSRASSSKLSELKRKAFPENGRAERIAKSLAAVNATQVTHLSSSEWRRIAKADIEDQY